MNALCLLVCAGILVSTAHADCADGLPYRRIACVNATHFERTDSSGNICDVSACRFGWACEGTSCVSPDGIAGHILRGADFQIVESVPVSQFSQCTASQSADVASGLMLCDVWHSTRAAQPTFAHILGNTWVHFGFGPNASAPACSASPAAWRACFAANVAAQLRAFQAESPELLASGGLMEFLDQANLDDPGDFPAAVCVPGSVGQWGGNTTCVPDVTAAAGQAYYIAWGQAFIDAGSEDARARGAGGGMREWGAMTLPPPTPHWQSAPISSIPPPPHSPLAVRAIFFGQARLTGGSAADGSDGVTPAGAAGFLAVIDALRAYGSTRGAGRLYFGPQAAASLTLSNGTDVADWVYGAQHLENHTAAPFLTQVGREGAPLRSGCGADRDAFAPSRSRRDGAAATAQRLLRHDPVWLRRLSRRQPCKRRHQRRWRRRGPAPPDRARLRQLQWRPRVRQPPPPPPHSAAATATRACLCPPAPPPQRVRRYPAPRCVARRRPAAALH